MTNRPAPTRRAGPGIRRGQAAAGYLFTAPAVILLGLFLAVPVLMALWVSVSDWGGRGSPFSSDVGFVGADNYAELLAGGGLATQDLGTALRNNLWYVLLVVPLQTALSLALASFVNARVLRGRGLFRTAFYFPSITSSVAITVIWLFLFSSSGAVNRVLALVGITGPNWFQDPRGIVHTGLGALGLREGPGFLTDSTLLGISWWEWFAGPSVAMTGYVLMAVFTTSGTFMLLFLAALQNLSHEVQEAAMVDGASPLQRFFRVTLPQLKPTLFTVITLGLIGCWQVFDQIYAGTQGSPAKTTITPAYLSYTSAFENQQWGRAAAIAFILFAIIVFFTIVQRIVLRDRKVTARRMRWVTDARPGPSSTGSDVPPGPGAAPGSGAAPTAAHAPAMAAAAQAGTEGARAGAPARSDGPRADDPGAADPGAADPDAADPDRIDDEEAPR